ncbi:hypothetical protein BDZ94DRAFT_1001692 [Collybia nuda]|uniref:Protein kinase domain-containing protein n=1 Tax=Collybia nuda TaxID=64659 RepID=A0A9P5XZM6_9AGAR|nr:hypothetical protein BDZ94DRAFT_1001692 [Collybia nuda]
MKDKSISKILRRIAVGEDSLLCNNHALPMFAEFQFEDIIFGVFPKVGASVRNAYDSWPNNSVGDVVEMLMQMLEALAFIHDLNIAHRDAFRDDFVVQWHPESLRTIKISPSRPRVYLIDFEVAMIFPPELTVDECLVAGFHSGGSFTGIEEYARAHAPEFYSGEAYSHFKLDVWQLEKSFKDFKSTISPIDQVLKDMYYSNPTHRLSAKEALDILQTVVYSMTPESLLIKPVVAESL